MPEEVGPLLDTLAGRLSRLPGVKQVDYRLDPAVRRFLEVEAPRYLMLYFTPAELDTLGSHLSRAYMERALLKTGEPIPRSQLAIALGVERSDPLGVVDPVVMRLRKMRGLPQIKLVDGYFAVPDQQAFFLLVEPDARLAGIAGARDRARAIQQVLDQARADPALQPKLQGKRLLALGRPVAVLEGFNAALGDARRVVVASTLIVLALLLLLLRRVVAPFFIVGTVLYGIALTTAVASLLFGSVGVVSWVFIAVLIGFGDEFALYVITHYWITAPGSSDKAQALAAAIRRPGPGILLGGLTSAAAFVCLVVMSYPALVEVAWLTTIGLVIVLACAFTILPLALSFTEPGRATGSRWYRWTGAAHQIGRSRPAAWLVIWGSLVGISLVFALRVRFELHPWKLAARGIPVTRELEQLSQRLGASFTPFLMISEGKSPAEALARDALAVRVLDSIGPEAGVAGIVSLSRWLPSPEQQASSGEFVRTHGELFSAQRFERDFRAVAARMTRPDTILTKRYLPAVSRYLVFPEPVSLETLRRAGLGDFVDRHLHREGDRWFVVSEVFPNKIPWIGGVIERFTRGIEAAGPALAQVRFAGESLRGATHAAILRRDMLRATGLGVALILLLLMLRFRRPAPILLCLLPMVAGTAVVLGVMGLFGIELNVLTLAVIPLLAGLGSDDGIHIVDRLERGEPLADALAETGTPMAITTVTTIGGFASLGVAKFPGLGTAGLLLALGLVVCLVASLQLVPLMYQALRLNARSFRPAE
jgi:predicted RND superfamily exporter protein